MPKSKNRKGHKQKVAARNTRIKNEKKRIEKAQREFIMDLIKKEQESGAFNDTPTIDPITGPVIDGPVIEGPSI